jgi:hypothetical protein
MAMDNGVVEEEEMVDGVEKERREREREEKDLGHLRGRSTLVCSAGKRSCWLRKGHRLVTCTHPTLIEARTTQSQLCDTRAEIKQNDYDQLVGTVARVVAPTVRLSLSSPFTHPLQLITVRILKLIVSKLSYQCFRTLLDSPSSVLLLLPCLQNNSQQTPQSFRL